MLKKVAALLALALVAGCGSSMPASKAEPIARHLVYEKVTDATGIWIADVDGGNARLLVSDGHNPVISGDGKWVAYLGHCSRVTGRCKLEVMPTSGGKRKVLEDGTYAGFGWSPDSERIAALQVLLPASAALVSIDVVNRKEVTLAKGQLRGWSFSPDGRRIVYALAEEERSNGWPPDERIDLYVADRDGGQVKRITDSGDSTSPVWGPTAIAFAKQIPYRGWHRDELWQIQPDGSGNKTLMGPSTEKLLGRGFRHLGPVGWSDDGGALLAARIDDGGSIPVAVDPETGEARLLGLLDNGVEEQTAGTIGFSHDGKFVLASTYQHAGERDVKAATVFMFPYAGGKPTIVARDAVYPSWNR